MVTDARGNAIRASGTLTFTGLATHDDGTYSAITVTGTAIFVPLAALVILWVARLVRVRVTGKQPEPEAPRLPYSPAMERLRNITLAVSGIEILLWLVIGALNQMQDPQTLADAASVMFVIMLPSLAAFVMSLLRRGPLTAAVLAAFALTLLLPQLTVRILPQSWLREPPSRGNRSHRICGECCA